MYGLVNVKNKGSVMLTDSIDRGALETPELKDDLYQLQWLQNNNELTDSMANLFTAYNDYVVDTSDMIPVELFKQEKLCAFTHESIRDLKHEAPLSICKCIGPIYGDEYCPCKMKAEGLCYSTEHIDSINEFTHNLMEVIR